MPLYPNATRLIRANLEAVRKGERVGAVPIGALTDTQLAAINQSRAARKSPLPPVASEVIFVGRHAYESRCIRDGYTIEDVIEQIAGAMDEKAVFLNGSPMTANSESDTYETMAMATR
jgi:hypothetical protein